MNIQDRINELRRELSSLKKIIDESSIDEELDLDKAESKKYNPDNIGIIFQMILESLKKCSMTFESQIEIISHISPYTASHLSELVDEFEEERLRINEMFKEGIIGKVKAFDPEAIAEMIKTEENMQYLLSISEHISDIILTTYNSFRDILNFIERDS